MKKVFISYQRNYAKWVARAVRQALERRETDVFMDVEDIDSGRFENVILNQIGLCEHFIVLLTPDTARALYYSRDFTVGSRLRLVSSCLARVHCYAE